MQHSFITVYSAAFIHHILQQSSIHLSQFTEQHSFITVYRAAFIHHSLEQSSIHYITIQSSIYSSVHHSLQSNIHSSQFTEQHSFITVYRAAFIHHSLQSSIHSSQFTEKHSYITIYKQHSFITAQSSICSLQFRATCIPNRLGSIQSLLFTE